MNSNQQKIMFSLSQEELFVILTYLKVNSLMGLDSAVLTELSEQQVQIVLGVAERALIAREFLVVDKEGRFQLNPAILSVIGICVKPTRSLIINYDRPDYPTECFFFHAGDSTMVGHTIPMSAIHQFFVLENKDIILKSVSELLALNSQKSPMQMEDFVQLPQPLITQARDAAEEGGIEQAISVLSKTSLSPSFTKAFATSLTNPVANMTFVSLAHYSEKEDYADGFTILQGSNGFWILKPSEEDVPEKKDYISVKSVSAQTIKELVQELIKNLAP